MKDLIERLRKVATLCGDYPKFNTSKTITQEAADAIETLQAELAQTNTIADLEVKKLQAEKEELFYTLEGVMHSVDKWLDDGDYSPDRVKRAATMREKTLQIVERLQTELERAKRERDAAVADIPKRCCFCKHERHMYHVDGRVDGVCKTCVENNRLNWTWRGPQNKQEGMG